MYDMSKLKVGANTYDIKDEGARANILAIENVTGAKNLLPYPYYETTKTENGITFTDNGDGTVTASGTASADTFFMYRESYENLRLSKNGQQYTLSGCPVGGGSSSYSLFFNYKIDDNTWGDAVYDNGDGVDISYSYTGSSSGGIYYGGIRIKSGTVISTPITFKLMIRPAGTDHTYVPYSMTNRELTERVEILEGNIVAKELAPNESVFVDITNAQIVTIFTTRVIDGMSGVHIWDRTGGNTTVADIKSNAYISFAVNLTNNTMTITASGGATVNFMLIKK